METNPTAVIELTPRGRGALAVVLVAGPGAVGVVEACFQAANGRPLAVQLIDHIVLGRWGGPEGEELLVCRRAADRVEVHCHGGSAAVAAVVGQLTARGCRATPWQEWSLRTADDPLRAAARVAMAEAPTERTAAILLDQFQGALSDAIRAALDAIGAAQWPAATAALDAMLEFGDLGQHLAQPWRVVLAGRPNVGKSSLINALVGHQRAIVCDLPGTTRDVVTATTAVDGWPIELADTAGLRDSRDPVVLDSVEAAGEARAGAALAAADLVVLVFDATVEGDMVNPRYEFEERMPDTPHMLRVLNKIDLLPAPPTGETGCLHTSAVTDQGLDALVSAIGRALVPRVPAAGVAVPFAAEQIAALELAHAEVARQNAPGASAALQSLLSR